MPQLPVRFCIGTHMDQKHCVGADLALQVHFAGYHRCNLLPRKDCRDHPPGRFQEVSGTISSGAIFWHRFGEKCTEGEAGTGLPPQTQWGMGKNSRQQNACHIYTSSCSEAGDIQGNEIRRM